MYPPTPKNLPFERNVPRERGHVFQSGKFIWSPDSKFVVFLDGTPAGKSAVLVRVSNNELKAYVRPLKRDSCIANLSRAEFGISSGAGLPDVQLEFEGACPVLRLRGQEFSVAPVEVHKPPIRRPSFEDSKH